MAVAYMIMLEERPETYEREFDEVLRGRVSEIRERILSLVRPGMQVLDLGCGPGTLVIEAAKRGATVVGVDASCAMITAARRRAANEGQFPTLIEGDVIRTLESLAREGTTFDVIVSTFLLSELTPVEREVLLRRARDVLRSDGRMVIAAEILPEDDDDRRAFWRTRRKVQREMMRGNKGARNLSSPIDDLSSLMRACGLDVSLCENYGPEIRYVEACRSNDAPSSEHENRQKPYSGLVVRLRMAYDRVPGSWRGIPIQPGLYRAGSPSSNSPVIVTANYEYTYYTVMRALRADNLDAWVLVCDTDGINVWCAARGTHFNTDDVINMIYLTRLEDKVSHREVILPQLSAAGVVARQISERSEFRARYGPVRIHDLAQWLNVGRPSPKPRQMATVTFDIKERMTQSLVHVPFLMKMGLLYPFALASFALVFVSLGTAVFAPHVADLISALANSLLLFLGELLFALFAYSLVLGVVFPILPSHGNSFVRRGLGLAMLTLPVGALVMLLLRVGPRIFVSWLTIQFILSIALTLDYSGLTTVSDPKAIRAEYPLLRLLLIVGIPLLIAFNIVALYLGW